MNTVYFSQSKRIKEDLDHALGLTLSTPGLVIIIIHLFVTQCEQYNSAKYNNEADYDRIP